MTVPERQEALAARTRGCVSKPKESLVTHGFREIGEPCSPRAGHDSEESRPFRMDFDEMRSHLRLDDLSVRIRAM